MNGEFFLFRDNDFMSQIVYGETIPELKKKVLAFYEEKKHLLHSWAYNEKIEFIESIEDIGENGAVELGFDVEVVKIPIALPDNTSDENLTCCYKKYWSGEPNALTKYNPEP